MTDTIFALATPPGRAAVAVVRASGPVAANALRQVCGALPRPRRGVVRRLLDPSGAIIDRGLVLWFPGPRSYTGENCVEFHIHGNPTLVDALTETLLTHGLRLAAPGEFTRRAFDNGKLDLDQAEAVADLIDAETAAQARQALEQLGGALGQRFLAWRAELLSILAELEAAVDFPDEELPVDLVKRAGAALTNLGGALADALAGGVRGQRIREGYRIAIIGAPNAGKSTLFNSLLERQAAIVTPVPGATRDVIEAPLDVSGYRVVLADMAGIRATAEPVEEEGVRRAAMWAAGADLRLWVVDGAASEGEWELAHALVRPGDFCILNKSDRSPGRDLTWAVAAAEAGAVEVRSARLNEGGATEIASLLSQRVIRDLAGADFPSATRARHARLLRAAGDDLHRAMKIFTCSPELAADDVRRAARNLEAITGRVGSEDVLGAIFARFCVGK